MIARLTLAATILLVAAPRLDATNWNIALRNHMLVTPPAGVSVVEMSGVTYLGPVAGGLHRFLTVQEGHGTLTQFDLGFNASGDITSVGNVSNIAINFPNQFEGIAYTNPARNTAFASDESAAGPNIRELDLTTGASHQSIAIPPVFHANMVTNYGFESLTRSLDSTQMWTANEEALTVDGPLSTPSVGTTVRLLKLNVAGNTVTAASQYAYNVDKFHGPSLGNPSRSGLADLSIMPDGTLLALERSLANAAPAYLTQIYEINFAGATDVSVGALANGLDGQIYTPVNKDNLFHNSIDGAGGQNMEGLALGPRLANGNWVMVGVVDNGNGTDLLSSNTVVSFVASSNVTGDFDANGKVNGSDFLAWQRGLGKTVGAKLSDGDGDRDGDVDAADLAIWKAAAAAAVSNAAPEPTGFVILVAALPVLRRRPTSVRRCKDAA